MTTNSFGVKEDYRYRGGGDSHLKILITFLNNSNVSGKKKLSHKKIQQILTDKLCMHLLKLKAYFP